MEKGQHLRLLIVESATKKPIAYATGLQFHLSATTEDSTTKDTTDTTGTWNEYDVTQRNGDIQIDALIGVGTDAAAKLLGDIIDGVSDTAIDWELAIVGGANNRVVSTTICTGKGKLTNVNPTGANRQNASYTATINIYGPVSIAS